jgi:hypothetical protein
MSSNAQDIIRIAREFAKEAYWDLQVAKRLFENLKLNACVNNDEVFYIGRRILYLLQQASEKAAKAYLFAYIKSWIEPLVILVGKVDKSQYPISRIHEKLNSLNNRLEPKQIGHKSHKAFLNAICDIYEVFYKNKKFTVEYIRYFSDKFLRNLTEELPSIIKEYFKKSKNDSLRMLESEKMITDIIKNAIANVLQNNIIGYLEKLDLAEHTRKSIERICKEKKMSEPFLPCINEELLESLKPLKENYYKMRLEIEKQVSKEQVYEHIKKSNIETQIMEIVKAFGNINEDYVMNIIELQAESYRKYIISVASSIYFSDYLFTYLSKVYPCLAKYGTLGRYPVYINDSRNKICQDIEKLKHILEEVEFLVNTIKAGVEAI